MTPYVEGLPAPRAQQEGQSPPPPTVMDGLTRFLDWMMLGTFRGQMARLDEAQHAQVRIVSPERFQGTVQIIDYTPKELKWLRKQGKRDAKRVLS